ncbi:MULTISPECIES: nitrous oxide reductase accessory protein NosL [unclassified Exiguobacterium]|uniref:nitrous oxide reductase accessory protein NosL n=1 Tax=unclassified Exiguobacterium TaxID=2644629 RepID=UPI00191C566B|nr:MULTISPECIES: nitrous oxide reductase accessory protein NosL [unclassified Exiguobacterium]
MTTYKKMAGLFAASSLTLALGACSSAAAEPFDIEWGKTECEVCKMKVMDKQFAAEAIMDNGKGYAFDDIGCLMRDWYPEQTEEDIAAMYVKDYNTMDWVDLDEGTFVYNKEAKTPMAYNIVSFAKAADAETYAEENGGMVMDLDDLKEHTWERGEMNGHKKMNSDDDGEASDMSDAHDSDESSDGHGQ